MSELLYSAFEDVASGDPMALPGMISAAECRYLYWLTSSVFRGEGAVVEVGTFLGRSSSHLAGGLRASPHEGRLVCIDDFTWRSVWNKRAPLTLEDKESFQPYFEQNMAPYADLLTVIRSDAVAIAWDGEQIEILHVDSTKSWKSVLRLLHSLRPWFIPGRTIIAFQDYLHFPSFEIALALSCLDGIEPVHVVKDGSTVAFRVTGALLPETFPIHDSYLKWPLGKLLAEWRTIMDVLPADAAKRLAPGLSLALLALDEPEQARDELRRIAPDAEQARQIASTMKVRRHTPAGKIFMAELERLRKHP